MTVAEGLRVGGEAGFPIPANIGGEEDAKRSVPRFEPG